MFHHVLVLDGDPLIRNRIASLLEQRNYTSDQAATADEAFALLDSNDYGLVMLDLMLPDGNGFDVLATMRNRFPEKSAHTIVMTNADPKFVSNLPGEGWCAVLVKPFTAAELYRIIELCLGGHADVVYQ